MEFSLKNVNEYQLITKEKILESIYEYEIFEHYYGRNIIVDVRKMYLSPFRHDKHPTCKFFKGRDGRLLFIDFGNEGSVVDCFGFVCKMKNCDLPTALKLIAQDFRLSLDIGRDEIIKIPKKYFDNSERMISLPEKTLIVKTKVYDVWDMLYWSSFYISRKTIEKFNVFATERVYLDNKVIWTATKEKPIFTYYFKKEKKKKVYNPNNEFKFLSSPNISQIMQGEEQLDYDNNEVLIITKSLKDVMVLYELGYSSVAPNSESYDLPINKLIEYKKRFKKIILFYDNDNPGLTAAHKLYVRYKDIIDGYIHIDTTYMQKDISDYIKQYGIQYTKNYLITLLSKYEK